MRRIAAIAIAIVLLAVAGWFAMRAFMATPDDLDLSRTKASAKGVYRVSIEPELIPIQKNVLHSWFLTLTTPDGSAVEDARITMDGGMPQHGHGLPTQPAATGYVGDGRYRIEGVKFSMSGWWELKFTISAAPGDDTVTFNLML